MIVESKNLARKDEEEDFFSFLFQGDESFGRFFTGELLIRNAGILSSSA